MNSINVSPYIVNNFSDYNCYQLIIHLDNRLNIQELHCNEFYEIRSVFDGLQLKVSQSVSKYTDDSLLANFGNPVIIRATSS